MRKYILERLVYTVILLLLVSILIFVMVRLLPGDPVSFAAMANSDLADKTIMAELRAMEPRAHAPAGHEPHIPVPSGPNERW